MSVHQMDRETDSRSDGHTIRDRLPAKAISQENVSLWSIVKNCIGKDLSKIAMPVVFNEPLSFLQRITENGEYVDLLEEADASDDVIRRMEIVAAFAVGGLSNNSNRMYKPFNSLLGETYELSLPKPGYRIVCEQVSHHPPISAYHGESESFVLRGSVQPKLKFWGKSIEIKPDGFVNLELKRHNEVYTWRNVNCCVHNVIIGKLWFEQYGVMEIQNHAHNVKAVLNFKQAGWFGRDLNRVDGFIFSGDERVKFLYGKWTDYLKSADVGDYEQHMSESPLRSFKAPDKPSEVANGNTSNTQNKMFSKVNSLARQLTGSSLDDPRPDACSEDSQPSEPPGLEGEIPKSDSSQSLDIPNSKFLWRVTPRPDHADQYYNFTRLSMTLNQEFPGMRDSLPPTDSRFRPDVRILEQGDVDKASSEKSRLEEKQRESRKVMRKKGISWHPLWFDMRMNPHTKQEDWMFNSKYWKRDFASCPDIF